MSDLIFKTETELEEFRQRCIVAIEREDPYFNSPYTHTFISKYCGQLAAVEEALWVVRGVRERKGK